MWTWNEIREKFGEIAPKLKAGSWPALFTSMAAGAEYASGHLPEAAMWAAPLAAVATHFFIVLSAHKAEEAVSALSTDSSNHDLEKAFVEALRPVLSNTGKSIGRSGKRIGGDPTLHLWFELWDKRLDVKTPEDASALFHGANQPDPVQGVKPSADLWPYFEEDLLRWAREQKALQKGCELDTSSLPEEIVNVLARLPEDTYNELKHRVREEASGRAWIAWQQRFFEESARTGAKVTEILALLNDRLPPPPPRKKDPTPYLQSVLADTQHIDIQKLRVPDGSVKQFHITELYTPLTTLLSAGPEEKSSEKEAVLRSLEGLRTDGHRTVPLQDALRNHRLLLIGDPGAGKSTFLRRIAFDVSNALLSHAKPEMTPDGGCPFPILISAFEFAAFVKKAVPSDPSAPGWAVRYLASQKHFDLDEEFFRERMREGCLLMIDGLDEVTDWAPHEFVGFLQSLARVFGNTRIVATSRPEADGGETDIPGFTAVRIGPLEPAAIRTFVEKWFGALKRPADQEGLLLAIESRPEIEEMASNPVMLTALAALQSNGRVIPEERSELYTSILEWLAEAHARSTSTKPAVRLRRFRQLAYKMSADRRGKQIQIPRLKAAAIIEAEFGAVEDAEAFLKEEEIHSGIVVGRGNRVKFWHLTFQEHLAAQYLLVRDQLRRKLLDRLYDPTWRETVLLLAGLLNREGLLDDFVKEALDRLPESATLADRAKCVGLIGQIVHDLRTYKYQPADPRYKANLDRCLAIFSDTSESRAIPFETRLEAAEALGQAGDPRLRGDNWITVEGGSFWMGAQPLTPEGRNYDPPAYDDERPVRKQNVRSFRMGLYLVTVSEYESFINHKGYQKTELWAAGGFGDFKEPDDWNKQLAHPNRPVVGVSWYEASAYCAWIAPGGRLPTEVEWEYGARFGRDNARYPWGDEPPDAARANYIEDGPGHPTPVGLYPAGRTQNGIQDMAGNVWEWTSCNYSREGKVLRGGAWINPGSILRVSCRAEVRPVQRTHGLGFRCARDLT